MSTAPNQKLTSYHWLLFIICFFTTVFAGTVSTLMSVYLPVVVKDLAGNKTSAQLSIIGAYINALFILGAAAGGFVAGIISDKAGRKTGLILSVFCYGLFAILTGFMTNWWGVIICRFLSGIGLGGVLVTTTTLIIEEWPQKTRAIFIGFLSIAIPVGIFSAGVIDYFISSWRQGFLIGIFPLAIGILAILFLKESQKWLCNKEQIIAQAKEKVSINEPSHRLNLIMGSIIFGCMLIGLWAIFSWIPSWIEQLITTGNAQKERGLSMMVLGMGGLIGGGLSGWFIHAIGLRKCILVCFGLCAVLSVVLFKTNAFFSSVIYVEIALLAVSFGASQGVLSVYIPLLFPVDIRATATGFCFNTGRLLTAIAVFFIGVLVTEFKGYGNALFIFSFVFFVGFLATLFSPAVDLKEDHNNNNELSSPEGKIKIAVTK